MRSTTSFSQASASCAGLCHPKLAYVLLWRLDKISLLAPQSVLPTCHLFIYGGVSFYCLRPEYGAPNIERGMPTRYADFVRLSFQICSKVEKIVKIVVCRLGMPTRYADWVCRQVCRLSALLCQLSLPNKMTQSHIYIYIYIHMIYIYIYIYIYTPGRIYTLYIYIYIPIDHPLSTR